MAPQATTVYPIRRLSLLAALAVLLVGAACRFPFAFNQATQPAPQAPLADPAPFISTIRGEDGIEIEFRGNSRGYRPGEEASFLLDVRNGKTEAWETKYCLLLVARDGSFLSLVESPLNLLPQETHSQIIQVRLPADLEPDAYGLNLIIPDRLTLVNTIYLIEDIQNITAPWTEGTCPP
jgi:hypothetical protein